jgi:hypothetical protein
VIGDGGFKAMVSKCELRRAQVPNGSARPVICAIFSWFRTTCRPEREQWSAVDFLRPLASRLTLENA